jgi:hypothetical protein
MNVLPVHERLLESWGDDAGFHGQKERRTGAEMPRMAAMSTCGSRAR